MKLSDCAKRSWKVGAAFCWPCTVRPETVVEGAGGASANAAPAKASRAVSAHRPALIMRPSLESPPTSVATVARGFRRLGGPATFDPQAENHGASDGT